MHAQDASGRSFQRVLPAERTRQERLTVDDRRAPAVAQYVAASVLHCHSVRAFGSSRRIVWVGVNDAQASERLLYSDSAGRNAAMRSVEKLEVRMGHSTFYVPSVRWAG